ncbi:MAG: metallophosphoesterase, partial [Treponemataceae bacterium]|nr:metallophosphoesterase [Treponemataceae bacterium]
FILSDIHYDFYLKSYHNSNLEVTKTFIEEIPNRYKNVVLCLGNHDLVLTWDLDKAGTPRFLTSEEKIAAIKAFCVNFPNVHLLDGDCVTIDGITFGGTMGMWDMSFIRDYGLDQKYSEMKTWWKHCWFDGVHWNYCNQDLEAIKELEFGKIHKVLVQKPDVMITHFSPLPPEFLMPEAYRRDFVSTMFYFDDRIARNYLSDNPTAIWCSGHTHTAFIDDRIFVHPNGYPGENPYLMNNLQKQQFLIEM